MNPTGQSSQQQQQQSGGWKIEKEKRSPSRSRTAKRKGPPITSSLNGQNPAQLHKIMSLFQ